MSNCKTISVCNQKGGVGKTTTTVNLGVGLAMQGKKVLLIDADPQGDLTTCLGWQDTDGLGITLATKLTDVINETMTDPMVGILHHEEGVDLVPANLELSAMEFNLVNAMSRETTLKNYLSQVKNRYDYVIIDCMPSLGMVTLNALSAADSVIIPVQAQYLPAKGMTQLVQTISKVKKYINPDIKIDGMLLTLVDSRTNLAKSTVEALRANFGNQIRMYRTQIPIAVKAAETSSKGKSIYAYEPNSTVSKAYVVQTYTKVIQRCMLMSTDPGDLVLDITCGSGTTAYVAEQWGRRWITCDTSRVAITLAKQRLMTATFNYYKLAHEEQGVGSGFVYKTVPHITLKSIANNEPPAQEVLYDQPEIDKTKVRVAGPFTVEALPAPVVKPLDDTLLNGDDVSAKQTDWRDQLLATGILGRGGARLEFSRVEPLSGTRYLQAEAETKEDTPRRAVICFAGETKPLDSRMVALALDEAENLRPAPKLIVFAAFQFDPEAAKDIDSTNWPGVTLLKAQMNTDLMTEDLKKKRSSDQSFWLVGQPDVELIHDKRTKDKYKVKVNGFDYYDVKKGTVESGSTSRIAMWMLDMDYDGMCIEPDMVFFPMGGKKDGWNKLAKTLKTEINMDLIDKYAGNESLWFTAQPNTAIAVKIIDDRGIESLRVIRIGDE